MTEAIPVSGTLVDNIDESEGTPPIPLDAGQFAVGDLVAGKYRIVGLIGKGGMGKVYKAFQRDIRRAVALKVAETRASDPAWAKRFHREVQIIAGLMHPNTITVFESGELEPGRLFFSMEFLDGIPLSRAIRAGESFDEWRIIRIVSQVLKSLGEAHEAGIVHRDLSPDNVFLINQFGEKDYVKVLDFGVAKGSLFEGSGIESLTAAGMFVGKPIYASPEQADGTEDLDGRSDLYSIGILMYQMASGSVPFRKSTPVRTLAAHLTETPKPVSEVSKYRLREDMAELIMSLLEKSRDKRPTSAQAVLDRLEEIHQLMDDERRTPPPTTEEDFLTTVEMTTGSSVRTLRSMIRRKKILVFVGLVAISVVILAVWKLGSGILTPGLEQPPRVVAPAPEGNPATPVVPIGGTAARADSIDTSDAELVDDAITEPMPASLVDVPVSNPVSSQVTTAIRPSEEEKKIKKKTRSKRLRKLKKAKQTQKKSPTKPNKGGWGF